MKSGQAGQKQPISFMSWAFEVPQPQKSSVGWCFSSECRL